MTGPGYGPSIDWTRWAEDIARHIRDPSALASRLTGGIAALLWAIVLLGGAGRTSGATAILAGLATVVTLVSVLLWKRRRAVRP